MRARWWGEIELAAFGERQELEIVRSFTVYAVIKSLGGRLGVGSGQTQTHLFEDTRKPSIHLFIPSSAKRAHSPALTAHICTYKTAAGNISRSDKLQLSFNVH